MISSTHITVGAAIGLLIESYFGISFGTVVASFIAGMASHHLLDAVPHTDPGSFREEGDARPAYGREVWFALTDNILATGFVLWVFFTREGSLAMLFGAAGGNMPDVFHGVKTWAVLAREKIFPRYFEFHEKFHFTARGKWIPFGVFTNVFFIVLSVWYIFKF